MPPTVILPLRNPSEGKSRLAPVLVPSLRRALVEAMFTDVVAAVARARVDEVVVAAQGAEAQRFARSHGLSTVRDATSDGGLVAAVAGATGRFLDRDVAVIATDLPGLTTTDVEMLLEPDVEVIVAPTRRGGTGGLVRRPARCLTADYGPDSAHRNVVTGREAGLRVVTVDAVGLHDDVDVADDLIALTATAVGPSTARLLDTIAAQVGALSDHPQNAGGHAPPASSRTR